MSFRPEKYLDKEIKNSVFVAELGFGKVGLTRRSFLFLDVEMPLNTISLLYICTYLPTTH
jgi:hypothetical protein